MSEPDSAASERTRAGGGRRSLTLLLVLVVVWGLLMRKFGGGDVYGVMGPFALVVIAAVRFLRGRAMRTWFRPDLRSMALGLSVGAVMTLGTYPAFHLAVRLVPGLDTTVKSLYQAAHGSNLRAMAWVAVLVFAEELLWRGALLEGLENRTGPALAFALSVLTYAFAQLGSGSWVVFTLALVCGVLWTLTRRYSGSLVASTLAHLMWTECVILLVPVT